MIRALLALLAVCAAVPVFAQDRIEAFLSDVTIARNGDLAVTETIRFAVTGDTIHHGINRDFPTRYRNRLGQRTRVGFDVVEVRRDGAPEPYERSGLTNGVRLRIGSPDVTIAPGRHVWTIRYRTTRQIAFGGTGDELYWNATGTGWTFPIDRAEARISLPSPARFGDRAVYTGPQGSTARDAAVIAERPGFIAFATTRPLGPEEGLTVAAAFPKGVIDAPGGSRRLGWWLADWGALAAGLAGLAAVLGFHVYAWAKVGRGPRAGPVVPRFAPPDGLSAAGMRFVWRMKADNRGFTAAIVDSAVRGGLRIRKEAGSGLFARAVTTLERPPTPAALPPAEAAMADALFANTSNLVLRQENHATLQAASRALRQRFQADYEGRLFRSNARWTFAAFLVIPLALFAAAWAAMLVRAPAASRLELMLPPAGIALAALVWLGGAPGRAGWGRWLGCAVAFLAAGALLFVAFGTAVSVLAAGEWAVFLPALALPFAFAGARWMYAPTAEGRAVMDRIAGFRHYLGITEEARLDTLHPPEKTPELFERYLPCAIALEVENRWADRFAGVLAAAAATGAVAGTAAWYSGDGSFWDDPGGFTNSVGASLASSVASASASPGSDSGGSGSSGGGSSGGGGGGGGGSGW